MLSFLKVHAVKKKLEEVEAYLDQVLHFEPPEIREFALRTLHAGGKRVRPSLTILTASLFKNEDNIVPLAAAMELLHMASLIHDDVVDEADTRRGAYKRQKASVRRRLDSKRNSASRNRRIPLR